MLYDGQYYYTYDADGNRTAKFMSSTGRVGRPAHEHHGLHVEQRQRVHAVEIFRATPTTAISPLPSEVDYVPTMPSAGWCRKRQRRGQNYIYDGQNLALVLNSSGQVTERELYGPAVDQILAHEEVTPLSTGSIQAAGTVNWYLTDNQGTVRDVVQLQRHDNA